MSAHNGLAIDRLLTEPPLAAFEGLTADEVRTIVCHSSVIKRATGAYLQNRGQKSTGLLILLQGVGITTLDLAGYRSITIALSTRGALFGESCLHNGHACCHNVMCFEDCTLLSIEKVDVIGILRSVPRLGQNLFLLSCAGVDQWATRSHLLLRPVACLRVAAVLLELAAAYGTGPPQAVTIRRKISQQALAELAGLSLRHTYRGFTQLQSAEIVAFWGKRRLLVCNTEQLQLCLASHAAGAIGRPAKKSAQNRT